MGIAISEAERQLACSIVRYGFAATIEVTNALVDSDEKVGQSLVARGYLEELVGAERTILAGLAYNGDLVDPEKMNGLDFVIDLTCYDHGRLEKVSYEMLGDCYLKKGLLTHSHASLIERILESYGGEMPLPMFFASSGINACSDKVGEKPEDYSKLLSTIKGLCMELYVKSLFREEIEDCVIYHRHSFKYRGQNEKQIKEHEADEIVICNESQFYSALERISRNDKFDTWVKLWYPL